MIRHLFPQLSRRRGRWKIFVADVGSEGFDGASSGMEKRVPVKNQYERRLVLMDVCVIIIKVNARCQGAPQTTLHVKAFSRVVNLTRGWDWMCQQWDRMGRDVTGCDSRGTRRDGMGRYGTGGDGGGRGWDSSGTRWDGM